LAGESIRVPQKKRTYKKTTFRRRVEAAMLGRIRGDVKSKEPPSPYTEKKEGKLLETRGTNPDIKKDNEVAQL